MLVYLPNRSVSQVAFEMSSQKTILRPCSRPTYASILLGPEKFEDASSRNSAKQVSLRQTPEVRQVLAEKPVDSEKIRTDLNNNTSVRGAKNELQRSAAKENQYSPNRSPRSKHAEVRDGLATVKEQGVKAPSSESLESVSLKNKRSAADYPGKRMKLDQGNEEAPKKEANDFRSPVGRAESEAPQVDSDGWQTRRSSSKKTRNENKAQQFYRQQNQPSRGGYQGGYQGPRSGGAGQAARDGQKFGSWSRGARGDARRSTVFYATNRGGSRQARGQTSAPSFGKQTENSANERVSARNRSRPDSMGTASNPGAEPQGQKIFEKKVDFVPTPTITAAATIIRRPDLTPPPPPTCGIFSYRDVLAKGLKSPPATQNRGSTPLSAPGAFPQSVSPSFTAPSAQARSSSVSTSSTALVSAYPSFAAPAQLVSSAEPALVTSVSSAPLSSPVARFSPSRLSNCSVPVNDSLSESLMKCENRIIAESEELEYSSKAVHETEVETSTSSENEASRHFSSFSIPHSGANAESEPKQGQKSVNNECVDFVRQSAFLKEKSPSDEFSKEESSVEIEEASERKEKTDEAIKTSPEPRKLGVISEKVGADTTAGEYSSKPKTSPSKLLSNIHVELADAVKISYSAALKKSTSSDGSPKDAAKNISAGSRGQILSKENESFPLDEKIQSALEHNVSARETLWHTTVGFPDVIDSIQELDASCSDGIPSAPAITVVDACDRSVIHQSPKVLNLELDSFLNNGTETEVNENKLPVPPPTPTELFNDPKLRDNSSMESFAVISSVAKELENNSTKLWMENNSDCIQASGADEFPISESCAPSMKETSSFLSTTQSPAGPQRSNKTCIENAEPLSSRDFSTRAEESFGGEKSVDSPGQKFSNDGEKTSTQSEQLGKSLLEHGPRADIPLVIKRVDKRGIFFPDAAQSWNSSNESANTETVLPQRSKQFRSRDSTDDDRNLIVEKSPDPLEKTIGTDESKCAEISVESETVKEKTATNNSSSWSLANIDGSTDSYSGVTTSSLSQDKKTDLVKSARATVSSKIWTEEGNELGLPRTDILGPDKTPLEILLDTQTPASVLKPTEFYTQGSPSKLNELAAISAEESLPSLAVTNTVTSHSNAHELDSFPKLSSVPSRQSDFVNLQTVPKTVSDTMPVSEPTVTQTHEPVSVAATGAPPITGVAPMQLSQHQASYQPQPSQTPTSTMNVTARSETEYPSMPRITSVNLPPHLNYMQSHPPPPLQYHSPYDPHWSRNFSMDINQSEWLNVNRYATPDRDFSRPPPPLHPIHPVPQPMNYFNYPSPLQAQKDGVFTGYNYSPSPFQPAGYRFPTLPPFVQRPPPPLPSQFNSGVFGRPYDNRGGLPHRFSPEYRQQNNFSFAQKQYNDGERIRGTASQMHSHYRDDTTSSSAQPYKATGGGSQPDNRFNSRDQRNGGRSIQPHHPQDPTLGDFLPRQLDNYRNDKISQDFGLSHSWKKSYDKKGFGNARKNYKSEHKDEHYLQMGNTETFRDQEQPGDMRRKNLYKGPTSNEELSKHANKQSDKSNYSQVEAVKVRAERDAYSGGVSGYPEKCPYPPFQQNSDVYLNHLMPTMMPPVELNFNALASPYMDMNKEIPGDKQASSAALADYSTSNMEKTDYEEQTSQVSSLACDNIQDFCTGGWKYYNEAISSPSGLRIHQSTYVPYVNPCGSVPPAYMPTDVRARVQWLGFPKAHEAYTARINSQRSLRMDVTVVCSKGSAVCCNSDILGTCSSYFYERLVGRTEEYITIFVNIPSKIMKHFLQMMSCGEAFVPMNDVNDVIMRAPVYLNLNP